MKYLLSVLISLVLFSCTKNDDISPMERNQLSQENTTLQMEEIKIGKYIWTTKNLDVSRYQSGPDSGKLIKKASYSSEWDNTGTLAAWCWYMNDSLRYSKYGRIYNGKEHYYIIPKGYHIPTINEWTDLFQTLGNYVNDYENSPFKLLYGGYRDFSGPTNSLGWYQGFSPEAVQETRFWTSKIPPPTYSLTRNNDLISVMMKKNYRGNYVPCELTDHMSWPITSGGNMGTRTDRGVGRYIRLVKDY